LKTEMTVSTPPPHVENSYRPDTAGANSNQSEGETAAADVAQEEGTGMSLGCAEALSLLTITVYGKGPVPGRAIGVTLRLVALGPPTEGVTYLDDPEETVLATVTMPTRFVEPEPEEVEGEELEEGELPEGEVAEGEEGAEGEPRAEGEGEAPSGEQETSEE